MEILLKRFKMDELGSNGDDSLGAFLKCGIPKTIGFNHDLYDLEIQQVGNLQLASSPGDDEDEFGTPHAWHSFYSRGHMATEYPPFIDNFLIKTFVLMVDCPFPCLNMGSKPPKNCINSGWVSQIGSA